MCAILDWGRSGGGFLPDEGFPPPSLNGLPDWTMMGSSPNVMAWERGTEEERLVLPGDVLRSAGIPSRGGPCLVSF